MSEQRYSLPVKTAAFLLLLFTLVTGVFCGTAACFLASQGAYTLSRGDMLNQGLQSRIENLARGIAGAYAQEHYGQEDPGWDAYVYFYDGQYALYPKAYTGESNYRYTIRSADGTVLAGNYQGEEALAFRETLVDTPGYYLTNSWGYTYWTELDESLVVTGYVLRDMDVEDSFSYYVKLVNTFYASRVTLIVITLSCLVAVICLVIFLMSSAGHRPGVPGITLGLLDRIPTDLYLGAVLGLVFLLVAAFLEAGWWQAWVQVVTGGAALAVCGALIMAFAMTMSTRLKYGKGYWWRHSLTGGIALFLCRALRQLYRAIPLIWRWLALGAGLLIFSGLLLEPCCEPEAILLLLCLWTAVISYLAWAFSRLQRSVRRLARGNLQEPVNTRGLVGSFRQIGDNLNTLGQAANLAVEERLRSERMKTELITNVSHDIKTPLTSIVSYVDLLQKPHTPEQGAEYLEVLARQSQRLKKLTEDLVELSKASSGTIPVELATLNVVELVNQALAEYQTKLETAGLTVVLTAVQEEIPVSADGRLFWRVMDNLLSNCIKYALSGTRVYVDVVKYEKQVMISVKNISRQALNLPAEELMERFVRGDRSRNTEGSGLGLNIAKTLMELQHGSLNLVVDGDLFKAILLFDLLPQPAPQPVS